MGFINIGRRKKPETDDADLDFIGDTSALVPVVRKERHAFAERLIELGLVKPDAVDAAIQEQKVTRERIGAILVKNGFLSQDVLIPAILAFKADRIATERVNSSRVPVDILDRMSIIISAETDTTIYVGTMSDEQAVRNIIAEHYPEKEIVFVAFLAENLPDFLDRMRRANSFLEADEDTRPDEMLDRLLYDALNQGASDVHIEPRGDSYAVFFRLLGERRLIHMGTIEEYNTIAAQIKDRGRMDLAERRIGQDGGFQLEHSGRFVDMRVATVATVDGEQVIVRILDPDAVNPSLDSLGITRINHWRRGITRQNGLCLICGPTGSGKTTTLNASIRELPRFSKKIYTVEDPVEYRIPYVGQVSINPQVGLDFPKAIRNFMRADPDMIVLGEVRDADTARNAIKAADTGHLVMATLHTGSIVSALSRLRDLEVDAYELRYMLRAVLVQTLIRTICKACEGAGHVGSHICPSCRGTGYSARTVVSECQSFTDSAEVDRVIEMTSPGYKASGPMPWPEMIDDAIDVMARGDTSIDELRRVFGSLADERVLERGLDPEAHALKIHQLR